MLLNKGVAMLPVQNILSLLSERKDENNCQNYYSKYDFDEVLELLADNKIIENDVLDSIKLFHLISEKYYNLWKVVIIQ